MAELREKSVLGELKSTATSKFDRELVIGPAAGGHGRINVGAETKTTRLVLGNERGESLLPSTESVGVPAPKPGSTQSGVRSELPHGGASMGLVHWTTAPRDLFAVREGRIVDGVEKRGEVIEGELGHGSPYGLGQERKTLSVEVSVRANKAEVGETLRDLIASAIVEMNVRPW